MMDETILKQAADEYLDMLCNNLPNLEECNHTFSKRFEKEMKHLIEKMEHPVKLSLRRFAACFIAALLLAFGTTMAVNVEAKEAFFAWVDEQYDTFTRFVFSGKPTKHATAYSPGWIPEGYEPYDNFPIQGGQTFLYVDSAGNILNVSYSSSPENLKLYMYSEDCVQKELLIGGISAKLFASKNTSDTLELVWQDNDGTLFAVSCNCDESTLVRIAENIVKK